MKKAIVLILLSGCYHMRNARFVDGSESTGKAWFCAEDDDPTNPGGIACGEAGAVMQFMKTPPIPLPDGGQADM